jgi:FkbM family methyltransferase
LTDSQRGLYENARRDYCRKDMILKFFPSPLLKNRYFSKAYRVLVCPVFFGWLRLKYRQSRSHALKRLGSEYGGWYVPVDRLTKDSIVYSAGVGGDTTFDEQLIEQVGCHIIGIDPTPNAVEHVTAVRGINKSFSRNFTHLEVALWCSETELHLFEPRNDGSYRGSYSAHNLQGMPNFIRVKAKRLVNIMEQCGHNRIDLLKLDIEGAEYEVLTDMIRSNISPRWLAVEFDQPVPFWTTGRMIESLVATGYELAHIDHWNVVFRLIDLAPITQESTLSNAKAIYDTTPQTNSSDDPVKRMS